MKNSVAKLASEQIAPYVKKMDEEATMDPEVIKMLFDNGVCEIKKFVDPFGG